MVLWARGGQLKRISQNSPSYSALYYVLLFPKGENGWHLRIPICGAQLREQGKNARKRDGEEHACSQVVPDTCYYAYCLHIRDSPQPPLFYGGKLFQQFVVDAWANCEQRKLNWARTHQYTLRSELYQGLQDTAVHDRHDREDIGITNFIQSYLHQIFNDFHGLKASLKPLRRTFNQCQSPLEAINNGQDIKQINW